MNHWFQADVESDTDRDSDSDRDRDIATILQFLVRSGQVRIITDGSDNLYQDDSDDDFFYLNNPPKVDKNPDTSRIKGSDLSQNIMLNSGAFNDKSRMDVLKMNPLPTMLKSREIGMRGRQRFSHGDQCQVSQRLLPNKMDVVDSYRGKVFCGTFARDGDVFMSAAQDYCIRLYDSYKSGFKLKKTIQARDVGWSILDTAVSPDGCNFVYCSWSECIHMCNVFGDHEVHEALPLYPDERRFCVFAMRFSQDGREILGGANDECLYVYNREENKRTLRIRSHEDDVNTVAFADSTSQILFSGGDDGLCKVWDRRTLRETAPKPVGILVGHEDGITYVDSRHCVVGDYKAAHLNSEAANLLKSFHIDNVGDGRHLITNSKDQTIKLWDMRAFSPDTSIEGSRRAVASHNWDYRWQRVPASLVRQKRKLSGDTSLMTYRGHNVLQTLIRCHFSPEATTGQSYIYTGCALGRVVVYEVLTGKIKAILRGHKGCVRDVSWHPYRNEIVSSSWDGTIAKWTYFGEMNFDSDDFDESVDLASPKSINESGLRRSQRLADQRRKQRSETC